MITETQKNALLKALGKKHISKIMAFAREKNVLNDDGAEFSHATYSHVFNRRLHHPRIETVIFAAAAHHHELTKKEEESRKEFMNEVTAQ